MATEFDARHSEYLSRVLLLPFVTAPQLALLLGDPEPTVNTDLRVLERQGWLDWVDSPVPIADAGRLYVLTDEARKRVAERLAAGPEAFPLPVAHSEILHRLACIEATIAFNRFVAELAAMTRREQDLELSEALTLPVRRREAWWPPGVHGLVLLQQGERIAPLFVAIDHPAAPAVNRTTAVAGWYAHRNGGRRCDPDAPIIVLAADDRVEEWKQAVAGAAERRGVLPLTVLVARPGTGFRGSLLAELRWHSQPKASQPITSVFDGAPETLPHSLRLHEWARRILGGAPARARRAQRERVSALSLFASPEQLRLLETAGRLPLLTESDLGRVLAVPPPLLRRQVDRAVQHGLVDGVIRPNGERHFVLGEFGFWLLAARAGVPFRRFANHTPFFAALPGAAGGRLQTLVRQFEHTVGANSFMLACLASSSGSAETAFVRWRNPVEAAVRFESGGMRRTLRPDGAGEVLHGDESHDFLLEWDRGTERIAVLIQKLDRYASYFGSGFSASTSASLLVVTSSPGREDVVWSAVGAAFRERVRAEGRVFTTTESLVERYGAFAAVWRCGPGLGRVSWLTAREQVPR